MTTKREPRFDIDLKYGQAGERYVDSLINLGASQIEVKRKTYLDLTVYVETHCDYGRRGEYQRSGIHGTTASHWAYVVADTGLCIFIPTDLLEVMLSHPSSRDAEETHGDCPTKGKLVNLNKLLSEIQQRRAALPSSDATACPPPAPRAKIEPPPIDFGHIPTAEEIEQRTGVRLRHDDAFYRAEAQRRD